VRLLVPSGQKAPEGMLRISVRVILGQEPFLDFLFAFLRAQARIRIELFITNVFLDLVADERQKAAHRTCGPSAA